MSDNQIGSQDKNSIEESGFATVAPEPIKIKDMEFGSVDANNEFGTIGTELFRSLFCVFPGFNLERVLNGRIRFICGDKGTGKTMLLRYAETAAREQGCATAFVKYRRDITALDRSDMARAGSISACTRNSEGDSGRGNTDDVVVTDSSETKKGYSIDYTAGWKLYLIKLIVSLCRKFQLPFFNEDSDNWNQLIELLNQAYGELDSPGSQRLLPEIQKGQAKLKTKHTEMGVKFKVRNAPTEERVPLARLAQHVQDLFSSLTVVRTSLPLYIFIDEIELSNKNTKQYDREARFIGDLIRAVDELDDLTRDRQIPVRIIMALRNQVIEAAGNVGYEINKAIEDYGTQVDWRRRTGDGAENPLLEILERRIVCNLPEDDQRRHDVWGAFFPPTVREVPIKRYILNQTWSKPRDIVRLLKTLQDSCGEASRFEERLFISVRQEYSKRSWGEIKEELSTRYQSDFIDGIERVLNGLPRYFELGDFREKFDRDCADYASVRKMSKSIDALSLLEVLFEFGVIGNTRKDSEDSGIFRFSAYGEVSMANDGTFAVHYPLRSRFAIR